MINGPASANYDVDLGPMVLTDWSHQTADELNSYDETQGPPLLDTGLINGTNVYGVAGINQTGFYYNTTVTPGTTYRMRLINIAIDTLFKFMIDDHNLTVITTDLVPIEPYTTEYVNIYIGKTFQNWLLSF